jgi:DNA polymerase sigma
MIGLSFLQMRSPPVLPCLHSMYFKQLQMAPNETPRSVIDGVDVSFFEDFKAIQGFGNANKESLGELLYAFFSYFAYEFDYNSFVLSVRHGKLLSKAQKGWNVAVSAKCRFLCVEEPFNPSRNLANSADLVSVMGLIDEFKRAADILAESSDLNKVCEKFLVPRNNMHKSRSSEHLIRPYTFRVGMRPNVRSFGTGMYPIHHKQMQTDNRNSGNLSFQHQNQDVVYYDDSSAYWEEPYDCFTGTKLTQTDYLNSDPSFPPLVSSVNGTSPELDEDKSSVNCVPEMKKLDSFPTSVWAPVSHLPPARTHFTSQENLRSGKSKNSNHKHHDGFRSGRSFSLNRGATGAHAHKKNNYHYNSDLSSLDEAGKRSYKGQKGSFKRVEDKKAAHQVLSSCKSDDGMNAIYERTNALSLDNSKRKGSKGTLVWSNLSHRHNRSTTVDEEERGRLASSAE